MRAKIKEVWKDEWREQEVGTVTEEVRDEECEG